MGSHFGGSASREVESQPRVMNPPQVNPLGLASRSQARVANLARDLRRPFPLSGFNWIKPPGIGPQVLVRGFPLARVPFWGSPVFSPAAE